MPACRRSQVTRAWLSCSCWPDGCARMFLAVDGADAMYASRVLADDRCAGSPRARGLDYRWRTHAKRAERWRARCRARWRAAPPLSAEMLSAEGSRGRVDWLCGSGGGVCSSPSHGDCGASRLRSGVRAAMHAHGVGAAALYRPGRAAGPAAEQGEVGSRDAWGAHRCRRLRGYWRVLCLSVACERDIISVVSSKPISARHTSPIPLYGTILTARARGGAGRCDAHHSVPPQRTAKRRGAQRAAQRARRSRHAAAARPHPPGSAAARLLAARPELEPDRLVGVVRLWEKERPEGAGLICVPYPPVGRSSCGRSSQRRQPLFAPLRGARPSRAARPCSASV